MNASLFRLVVCVVTLLIAPIVAAVEIREWTVPYPDSRPRDPSVAADGRVWFVGQTDNYLAVFDPSNERFTRYDLPEGTHPHTVVIAPDGSPWVAGNGNGTLLHYDAKGVLQKSHAVATDVVGRPDPHTIAMDGHGGFWFTMQNGNAVGHFTFADERVRIAKVPTAQARPYGIVATPSGDAWAVLFGVGKLARIQRADMALNEVALPRSISRPRRISLDGSGGVWYVDYAQGFLGRHDPSTGKTREWKAPSQASAPYALALVGDDHQCFFETAPQPNLLQCFDVRNERFVDAVAVPGGAGTVRHMVYDAKRHSLWFGTDKNTLGQANMYSPRPARVRDKP